MGEILVPVEEAQPGMVVASAIMDAAGRVIIPQGARLTPMAIKRLPKWGVTLIAVVAEDNGQGGGGGSEGSGKDASASGASDTADTVFIERVTMEVEERFSCMDKTTFNDEYKRIVIRHLFERGRGVVPGL